MTPNLTNLTLGAAIRQRRLQLNFTQEDLATRILSNQTTVSRVELGTTSLSFRLMVSFAVALDLRPSELVKLAEEIHEHERTFKQSDHDHR